MTDRERLLVSLLSTRGDEVVGAYTSVEIAGMLAELGREQRRPAIGGTTRISA